MSRPSFTSSSTTSLVPSRPTLVRSGIGGAGNYHKTSSNNVSSLFDSFTPQRLSRNSHFMTGVGGYGNRHDAEERLPLSAEEQLQYEELRKKNAPTNWHLGIGGIGNKVVS